MPILVLQYMFQFTSVTLLCLTLCKHMNCSMPVHHQLLEFTQTHIHRVGDAIQASHPLRPLFLLPTTLPRIRVFSNESTLHMRWPNYWSFSFSITPSKGLVGSPCSPRDSQESSPAPQFKNISSSVLSFLHSPVLTSIHDHCKNQSLD